MTTNPGPEFFNAQDKYQAAKTPEEKLRWLEEMYKNAPKHKASEKLVAEITYKISKLKQEVEKQKEQAKKKGGGYSLNVKKDGDGQIAIIGMPNSGKSLLLKTITGVEVEVAPYPFTTTKPEVGMMDYKGAKVQLVEVPALIGGSSQGKANGTQLLSLCRNADALILLHRTGEEKQAIIKELSNVGIIVERKKPRIFVQDTEFNGITIGGKQFLQMPEKELAEILKQMHIFKASVLLEEPTTREKLLEAMDKTLDYKNCLFLSTFGWKNDEGLAKSIFSLLEKIIVYTKKPGNEPDYSDPLVLAKGATISDVAQFVHKDIAQNLKYARVWGSAKFPGQRVSKDHMLQDGDIIEISA